MLLQMRYATNQLISSHISRQVSNVTPNEISDKPIDITTHIEGGIKYYFK